MPRATGPSPATDPRGAAQAQQDLAMAGLGDFDLPRTTVTRLAKSQVSREAISPNEFIELTGAVASHGRRDRSETRQSCLRMSSRR